MKKFTFVIALVGMLSAHGQGGFKGIGFDTDLNQITARLGVSEFASIELGFGMVFDGAADSSYEKFAMGISGVFLGHLQDWGPVDNYVFGGMVLNKLPQDNENIEVSLIGGLQPEITLMDRFAIGVRVGLDMQVAPDFLLQTRGDAVSVVGGLRFTLLLGGGSGSGSSYGSGSESSYPPSGSSF